MPDGELGTSFQQDEDHPATLVSAGRRRARDLLQRLHGRALSLATLRNRPARVAPGEHDRGLRPRAEEIIQTLKASCAIASVLSLGYIALLAVFAHGLLRLFLSSDTPFNEGAFLACGTGIIVLLAVRIPVEFGGLIVQAALLGVGRTRALLDSSLQISAGVWVPLLALVTWLRPSAAAYWLTIAVHTLLRALVNLRSLRLHLPSAADTPDLKPVQLSKRRMRSAFTKCWVQGSASGRSAITRACSRLRDT